MKGNLADLYRRVGEVCAALELFEDVLVINRELRDRAGEARTLFNTALAHDQLGDRARAEALAEEALAIFEAIGAQHHVATVRAALAKWQG